MGNTDTALVNPITIACRQAVTNLVEVEADAAVEEGQETKDVQLLRDAVHLMNFSRKKIVVRLDKPHKILLQQLRSTPHVQEQLKLRHD